MFCVIVVMFVLRRCVCDLLLRLSSCCLVVFVLFVDLCYFACDVVCVLLVVACCMFVVCCLLLVCECICFVGVYVMFRLFVLVSFWVVHVQSFAFVCFCC